MRWNPPVSESGSGWTTIARASWPRPGKKAACLSCGLALGALYVLGTFLARKDSIHRVVHELSALENWQL
jgi:hypothetical protein